MKRWIWTVMAFLILVCAGGCGDAESGQQKRENEGNQEMEEGNLTILSNDEVYAWCSTQDGYYYLTEDCIELKDGGYGSLLRYMDYQTRQEICLCNDTSCSHDTKSCNAVFAQDDFPTGSCRVFCWKQRLYLLSKQVDDDGAVSIDLTGNGSVMAETMPAALYEMNLDGTERKKIYTFPDGVTVEDCIIGSEHAIYFVTKKLDTKLEEGTSMTTSTDRNLVRLIPGGKAENLISMENAEEISWKIIGCFDKMLVLEGVCYPDGDQGDPNLSMEEWRKLYDQTETVFALLNLEEQQFQELFRLPNTGLFSCETEDGYLFLTRDGEEAIKRYDLRTGEEMELARLKENYIMDVIGDMLICHSWDETEDATVYLVKKENGQVMHSPLVNQCTGWPLEFICQAGDNVLLIYDYEADAYGDGSYEINRYQYGLISWDDLCAGNDAFLPIAMIGKGR